ncbi:TLP-20 [Euproctis pseudoconspersa nucleopolyhedrovirus]|uniref:TLP-20 n=1 Tax=Euproctis pseudoconspersa nucleopolyhedrovirus TaxID=307467 RepID=C3TWY1_9ABAC|nr:TLP-20 [Euproctis pseudoconspersa nucleopolyhedrovirus]ACO53523.1 TLP-20 [Euproctis pseudoconspersa nucleopolyhedrovirus]QUJ09263.1 TLP-20 protein [Gynaephora ruoergensis nucleopolyhedrovirus]
MYSVTTLSRLSNSFSLKSLYNIKCIIKKITLNNMATNNSGTVDISVYTILDKDINDCDKKVLSFIVQDEYHLKKLAIGAYTLNILDTQLLSDLMERDCVTVSCGDFVVCHNFTELANCGLNVILFNIKPTILKKGVCIFKIIYQDKQYNQQKLFNKKMTSNCHSRSGDIRTTIETTTPYDVHHSVQNITQQQIQNLESNENLFQKTFTKTLSFSSSSSSSSYNSKNNDDSDDCIKNNKNDDYDDTAEFEKNNLPDDERLGTTTVDADDLRPPVKKQKFNDRDHTE